MCRYEEIQKKLPVHAGTARAATARPATDNVYYILRDRQCVGSNVFGKRTRRQIGVRRTLTARLEDWIVVDDCHEPLVSKNLFQKAQEQLGGEYKQICQRRIDNPLSRKVYCGVCRHAIVRHGAKNMYYR